MQTLCNSYQTQSLPLDSLDKKVELLVNFLLHKYQMNEPITKADTTEAIIKEDRDDFFEIFRKPSECMELPFGVDFQEMDSTIYSYELVNKLDLIYEGSPLIILGMAFVKGNNHATEE